MFLMCLLIAVFPAMVVTLEKPYGVSEEMYCMGCQAVLKELDMALSHPPTRGMGETVSRALRQVCHENNFKKYEMNYKVAVEVCNHIKGDEGLEEILTSEYSRIHELNLKTSYLGITQKVCGSYFKACIDPEILEHGKDGGIIYNPDTQTFNIKSGSKVRKATPVSAQKEQANRTPTPAQETDQTPTLDEAPTPASLNTESHDEL